MKSKCFFPACPNKYHNRRAGLSFHELPTYEAFRQRWLQAIGSPRAPNGRSFICSDHFLPTDFICVSTKKHLRSNAVPQPIGNRADAAILRKKQEIEVSYAGGMRTSKWRFVDKEVAPLSRTEIVVSPSDSAVNTEAKIDDELELKGDDTTGLLYDDMFLLDKLDLSLHTVDRFEVQRTIENIASDNSVPSRKEIAGSLDVSDVQIESESNTDSTDSRQSNRESVDIDNNNDEQNSNERSKNVVQKQCGICNKPCRSLFSYKKHMTEKHPDIKQEKPVCKECGQTFRYLYYLKIHERSHTGEKPYDCPHCSKAFTTKHKQQLHIRTHSKKKPYKCNECGKGFVEANRLKTHKLIHTGEKLYECTYCSKTFKHKSAHWVHLRTHTKNKAFVCSECGKDFATGDKLKRHEMIHTGERPYKCLHCSKAFIEKSSLQIHIRIHMEEKPYVCSECGKKFVTTAKLNAHKKIHTGKTPYKCPHCPKTFISNHGRCRHVRTHMKEQCVCSECGERFNDQRTLKAHKQTHKGGKLYECSYCPKTFTSKFGHWGHMQKYHEKEIVKLKAK